MDVPVILTCVHTMPTRWNLGLLYALLLGTVINTKAINVFIPLAGFILPKVLYSMKLTFPSEISHKQP